jgi:hypothetical protein
MNLIVNVEFVKQSCVVLVEACRNVCCIVLTLLILYDILYCSAQIVKM